MEFRRAKETLAKYEKDILTLPGVVGVSTGIKNDKSKEICIRVFLNSPIPRGDVINQQLPENLEGIPVEVVISGDMISL